MSKLTKQVLATLAAVTVSMAIGGVAAAGIMAPCEGDTNGDEIVNIDDVVNVVLDFGYVGDDAPNNGDCNGDGKVDVDDIVDVILGWGQCP